MSTSPWSIASVRDLLAARAVSSAGSMVQVTAAGWYVLHTTHSSTAVGVLAALNFAPAVVGAPVGGMLVDRYDIRRLYMLLVVLQSIPPLIIGVLIIAGHMPLGLLYLLVFLGAIPGGLGGPVSAVMPPMAAPKELRSAVIAQASICYNIARISGPLIGSALVAFLSVGGAFLVNSASFWFNFFAIRKAKLCDDALAWEKAESGRYFHGVKRGLGFDVVRIAMLGALIFFGLVAPIQSLLPTVAATHGDAVGLLGVLFASLAAGGIAANPVIRRMLSRGWTNSFLVELGMVAGGPAILLLGISDHLVTDVLLLFIVGASWECLWVASKASIQLELPPDLTGRMLGLFYSVVTLSTAIGSLLLGLLFDGLGVRISLLIMGLIVCVIGITGVFRLRGRIRARTPADEQAATPGATEAADTAEPPAGS